MYHFQRYKMLQTIGYPISTKDILKINTKLKTIDWLDDENSSPHIPGEITMADKPISIDDASDIARLVTEIDEKTDKGVEALYHILSVIQTGGNSIEAIAYCYSALGLKGRRKKV